MALERITLPLPSPAANGTLQAALAASQGLQIQRPSVGTRRPQTLTKITLPAQGGSASAAPPGVALGSIAKSASTHTPTKGSLAHEQQTIDAIKSGRKKRFDLLEAIRVILLKEGAKREPSMPTKYHRTSLCKHAMTGLFVGLMKGAMDGRVKSWYGGLQTCGGIWTCPPCANKIQEIRRQEVAQAMAHFYGIGGMQAVMVTFTFPHSKGQALRLLLDCFSKALKAFKSGRAWKDFGEGVDFEGLIRSLEIMHGGNGWHPHTHELWFIKMLTEDEQKAFIDFVKERWLHVCTKAGLVDPVDVRKRADFIAHAVDVRFEARSSDYLAKMDDKANWGIDREIAKASSKSGKALKGGMHPFQLAHLGYEKLWIEYVDAIKGKAQLFWSPGLKDRAAVADKSDDEAASEEDDAEVLGLLDALQWRSVIDKKAKCRVLEMVEEGKSMDDIMAFLAQTSPPCPPLPGA